MCHNINCLQRIRRAWMPIIQVYLLFLKRSKYQRDKERATRNLVRFEGLGANSQHEVVRKTIWLFMDSRLVWFVPPLIAGHEKIGGTQPAVYTGAI